jgi:hypothetical protein
VAIAGCVFATAPAIAARKPPVHYVFAGVPWQAPADTVAARLTARGYHIEPGAATDRVSARGQLFDHAALLTAHLDEQHRLVRWTILIAPGAEPFPYPRMHATYEQAVEEASQKYGDPPVAALRFDFPYAYDDGRQDRALREDKADIRSEWISKSGDHLTIAMDASVSVVLTYDSPQWTALEARRQKKKGKDL